MDSTCYIGVGSNLGNSFELIVKAVELLPSKGLKFNRSASIYETEPVGFTADTNFLNTVFEIVTPFSAIKTLDLLLQIEHELGRTRTDNPNYTSRTLDLDILLFDEQVINNPELTVPHPKIQERNFVLHPLNELIPQQIHPTLYQTISSLYQQSEDPNLPVKRFNPLTVNQ